MNKKDEMTKSVFDMYQQYPFPDVDYKMDYSLPLVRFFVKNAPACKKNLLEFHHAYIMYLPPCLVQIA